MKRTPIVIEDRELLARPTIISPASAKDRIQQKDVDKEQYVQFRKDTEHRKEVMAVKSHFSFFQEDKTWNEQRKTEQRSDLERRRKEFIDMQTEESKKRDTFNKKVFSEDNHIYDRMQPPDTAQKSNSLRGLKKNTLISSTRQLVS